MILKIIDVNDLCDEDLRTWFWEMPKERQERCKRLPNTTAQKCCIAADFLARTSIADYRKTPVQSVKILHTEAGKPYVQGNPFHFSLAHSGTLVVCAISDHPIGVDVEGIRPVEGTLAKRICTEEERCFLEEAEGEEQNLRLLQIWTKKEAVFKIEGKLPRKDRKINTLNPADPGLSIQTQKYENYIISVAEQVITPECCS